MIKSMLFALPAFQQLNPIAKTVLGSALDKATPMLMDSLEVQGLFVTLDAVAKEHGTNLIDFVQSGAAFKEVLKRMGFDPKQFQQQQQSNQPRLVARQLSDGTTEFKVIRPGDEL